MYREAKQRLGDPVSAWADVVTDPDRRRRYHQARGKGGLVRVTWAEAVEMIAAAQVHTIKTYGPDRITNFSPIPAMSMVSHCVGTRFNHLVGGAMTAALAGVCAGQEVQGGAAVAPGVPDNADGLVHPAALPYCRPAP
jgi:nitrate reductase / nitrite oxidoreductase, alpha subunit